MFGPNPRLFFFNFRISLSLVLSKLAQCFMNQTHEFVFKRQRQTSKNNFFWDIKVATPLGFWC